MIILTQLIGYLAGILVAITMIPQIIHSLKTKSVEGLSLVMIIIFFCSMFLWFMYGVMISNYPLILTNGFATIISAVQVYIKVKYS